VITFSQAVKEAEKLRDYYFYNLEIPGTKALYLASEYCYRLYQDRQAKIIEEVLKNSRAQREIL